jgi:hypothetical protein
MDWPEKDPARVCQRQARKDGVFLYVFVQLFSWKDARANVEVKTKANVCKKPGSSVDEPTFKITANVQTNNQR